MSETKCPKCGEDISGFNENNIVRHHDKCLRNQLAAANAKYERAVECLRTVERYGNCKICGGEVTSPYHSASCELAAILKEAERETDLPKTH